jgi:ERCC4-type nuclease
MKSHPIPERTTLLVDSREPGEMVRLLRTVKNLDVQVEMLDVGDYVVQGHFAIERKTPIDFAQSVIGEDKRLFHQVSGLYQSGLKPIVLLEGDPYHQESMPIKNVDGMLSYMVMRGMHLVYTKSLPHSAAFIAKMVRHMVHGLGYADPAGSSAARKTPKDAPAFLLSCIPGVSSTIGRRLIERFGTVKAVCLASKAELLSVDGVGPGTAEKILNALGGC